MVASARKVENTVGAGDCVIGGLAVGMVRGLAREEALRLAVACGTAKVMSAGTGLLRRQDVEAILPEVVIHPLSF